MCDVWCVCVCVRVPDGYVADVLHSVSTRAHILHIVLRHVANTLVGVKM